MPKPKMTPGSKSPISGEVKPKYPNGTVGQEVTVVRGKPLPPTRVPGTVYIAARPAHNGAGYPKH